MKTDDPAQYFFAQKVNSIDVKDTLPKQQKIFSQYMEKAGIVGKVKIVTVPQEQNKILMRVQNLADIFDQDAATVQVNMATVVEGMWKAAHSSDSVVQPYTLTETSITGNIPMSEMQSRRLKWKTDDEDKVHKSNLSYTMDGDMIKLEPMRIRTFILEFKQI
jgi:hypothetical protein